MYVHHYLLISLPGQSFVFCNCKQNKCKINVKSLNHYLEILIKDETEF